METVVGIILAVLAFLILLIVIGLIVFLVRGSSSNSGQNGGNNASRALGRLTQGQQQASDYNNGFPVLNASQQQSQGAMYATPPNPLYRNNNVGAVPVQQTPYYNGAPINNGYQNVPPLPPPVPQQAVSATPVATPPRPQKFIPQGSFFIDGTDRRDLLVAHPEKECSTLSYVELGPPRAYIPEPSVFSPEPGPRLGPPPPMEMFQQNSSVAPPTTTYVDRRRGVADPGVGMPYQMNNPIAPSIATQGYKHQIVEPGVGPAYQYNSIAEPPMYTPGPGRGMAPPTLTPPPSFAMPPPDFTSGPRVREPKMPTFTDVSSCTTGANLAIIDADNVIASGAACPTNMNGLVVGNLGSQNINGISCPTGSTNNNGFQTNPIPPATTDFLF